MIKQDALDGNIVMVPLNGSPTFITEIPEGFTPFYSGQVLILAGDQTQGGDKNLSIKTEFSLPLLGDAVVLSQDVWHNITGG